MRSLSYEGGIIKSVEEMKFRSRWITVLRARWFLTGVSGWYVGG